MNADAEKRRGLQKSANAEKGRLKKSVDADAEKAFTSRVPASVIFLFHFRFLGAALGCRLIAAMLPRYA